VDRTGAMNSQACQEFLGCFGADVNGGHNRISNENGAPNGVLNNTSREKHALASSVVDGLLLLADVQLVVADQNNGGHDDVQLWRSIKARLTKYGRDWRRKSSLK
jgi:hypothetical protein